MNPTDPDALPLCPSAALEDLGKAWLWDVLEHGRPLRAFALRFDGAVVAYLNRCAHVPTEMDWQAGEFLDLSKRWILCSIHGAAYEPHDGRCIGGPCVGKRLTAVRVAERDGQVYWYPSRDVRPAPAALRLSAPAGADESPHEHPRPDAAGGP